MLGKLLKYDLKWMYKLLIVFYFLALIFALIGRVFSLIDNSMVFSFLSKFSCGVSVAMMFNILINNIMRIWSRYIHSIYKDESYLTHTLPVRKNDIYFSKVLTILITIFTSVLVIVVSFCTCYMGDGLINFLKMYISDSLWSVVALVIVILFLEILFLIFLGILAITIGYRNNKDKLVISLVWGGVIYTISSVISLIVLFVFGLFNSDIMALFKSGSSTIIPSFDILKLVLIIAGCIYFTYIVACVLIGNVLLNKGVNVD